MRGLWRRLRLWKVSRAAEDGGCGGGFGGEGRAVIGRFAFEGGEGVVVTVPAALMLWPERLSGPGPQAARAHEAADAISRAGKAGALEFAGHPLLSSSLTASRWT